MAVLAIAGVGQAGDWGLDKILETVPEVELISYDPNWPTNMTFAVKNNSPILTMTDITFGCAPDALDAGPNPEAIPEEVWRGEFKSNFRIKLEATVAEIGPGEKANFRCPVYITPENLHYARIHGTVAFTLLWWWQREHLSPPYIWMGHANPPHWIEGNIANP